MSNKQIYMHMYRLLMFTSFFQAINYLATAYEISCCGTIEKWRVWVRKAGTIKLQIWRYNGATGEYVLIGENTYIFAVGMYQTP